jgi:hypothetical protein
MFVLAPSTRFGYFIYPAAMILWLLVSQAGRNVAEQPVSPADRGSADQPAPEDPEALTIPVDPEALILPVDPEALILPVDPEVLTSPEDPEDPKILATPASG